ncbi:MAG: 5-(carboxyamino)imidazole ribonucleotide synthase [Cyclobacteriaceae bacterium]
MSQSFYQNFKLGVLGGGQLGRMLIQSAIDFNLDVSILDPDQNAPCRSLANNFEIGALSDYETVYQFGKKCDLITIEIENVNTQALKALQNEGKNVYPQPEVIELIQDKRKQKSFYQKNGIPTAEFVLVESAKELPELESFLPAFQKLGRAGYDGRGVQRIDNKAGFDQAFDAPSLLEKVVDFEKEISVIAARNADKEIEVFPVVELVFHPKHHLVEYLFAPATLEEKQIKQAIGLARQLIEKLDMVGLLAVEMFVTKEGEVLVNEMAPRTHNSGHQTIEANTTSQFEQHLRAILNLPLGNTDAITPSVMINLLGAPNHTGFACYQGLNQVLNIDGVHLHLYGKRLTKPFRKMGHVTITGRDIMDLRKKAKFVKQNLKVIS